MPSLHTNPFLISISRNFEKMDSLRIVILASTTILIVAAYVVDPEQNNGAKTKRNVISKPGVGMRLAVLRREDFPGEQERSEVCFDELGCFSNGYPFSYPASERVISLAPNTPDEIGTEFRFYAPKRNGFGQFIMNKNFTLWNIEDSGFDVASKTKFIIHGYLGGDAEWAVRLKQALILKERCNVFIVDWADGDGILYEQAVANVRVVGAEVGLFILKMMNATGLNPRNVHIIGHSLGAHGAGYAGKFVQNAVKKAKIGRITGLDPAGPYFNEVLEAVRLDKGDAYFVDVIHTNWAGNRFSGFGLQEPIGHFDFYPNDGEDQPGCPTAGESAVDIFLDVAGYISVPVYIYQYATGYTPDIGQKIDDVSCSHGRAYEYFIESLMDRDCEFKAMKCRSWEWYVAGACGKCHENGNDCVSMGYYADRYTRFAKGDGPHKFYLRIFKFPPYCIEKTDYFYLV